MSYRMNMWNCSDISLSTYVDHQISDPYWRHVKRPETRNFHLENIIERQLKKIKDLNEEKETLLEDIRVLEEDNRVLDEDNRVLKEYATDLRNEVQDLYEDLDKFDDEWIILEEHKKECSRLQYRLESQYEDVSMRIKYAESQNRIQNEKNIQLKRTLEKLHQDIRTLTEDRFKSDNNHRCEIDRLKVELRLERINADVRKTHTHSTKADVINKLHESNADLQNKLENLYQEKKIWNENLSRERDIRQKIENSKLHEINQLRDEVKILSEQLAKIKGNAECKEQEFARMKILLTQTSEENARLKNADQMLTHNREKTLELHTRVEQLLHDKTQLADALKREKESRKKKETHENSDIQEENRKLRKEIEQLHRKIENLNKDNAQKKENQYKMSTERNIEKANIKAADEIERKLQEKISDLEEKVNQLVVDKKKLTEELRHDKNTVVNKDSYENLKFKEKNQKLQNEFDELFHENQSLKKQLIREKENIKIKEKECIDMHQKMKSQKEHDLHLNATNRRAKQLEERNAELNNEIQRLLEEKSNMTNELKHERDMRKKLEQYGNTNLQETNQTLRNDATHLRFQNERLHEDLTREKDNFKKMEVDFYKISSDMKEKLEKQEQELERQRKKLSEQSVLNRNVDPGAKKTQADLQQQLDETRTRLKNVQKELDDAKSRLSRAMGDKLTDNNPNIADLSDKNRPTKISERYQELYDNQWTDAFEIVNRKYGNEENTINILRDILMDTLEFCKTQAANQMIQIRASFLKGEDLPENMKKQVKECRKAMAELYGKGLYREYCDQLRTSKPESMSTPSYVKECFEICWLMAVQDPPVEFGPDLHRGDTFNKEHYRAYTRSGERVDFVVWPVLLLHQNGPVLCKGVAQGK